jgi:predicted ATPase
LITGPNGSGKSNLYRALRLLAETAQGGVVNALAVKAELESTFWAGPEVVSRRMKSGEVIEGGPRNKVKRLHGLCGRRFQLRYRLGVSPPELSAFTLDPQIKHESIWVGPSYRPASELVERNGPMIRARTERSWRVLAQHTRCSTACSIKSAACEPRPKCCGCESRFAVGAFMITFTDLMRRCVSRSWARAHRCCTTMARTWLRPCKPSSKWATRSPAQRHQ